MNDFFEPSLGIDKENVFEPKSNVVGLIARGVGFVFRGVGKVASYSAKEKERQAELVIANNQIALCESASENQFFFDKKKQRNRINGCKEEARKKADKIKKELIEIEEENKKIEQENLELEDLKNKSKNRIEKEKLASNQKTATSNEKTVLLTNPLSIETKKNKGLIIGLSVGAGVLVIATIIFLVKRKN